VALITRGLPTTSLDGQFWNPRTTFLRTNRKSISYGS
jgi:hypothetical protein